MTTSVVLVSLYLLSFWSMFEITRVAGEQIEGAHLLNAKEQTPTECKQNGNMANRTTMIDQHYPVVDKNTMTSLIKAVGHKYQTIILDCLPVALASPNLRFTSSYADTFLHLPAHAARLNNDNQWSLAPLQVWIHPHLHIPFLRLEGQHQNRFISNPMDMAMYMVRQANFLYSEAQTVVGMLTLATPLLWFNYRIQVPYFRSELGVRNLKFGLLIENWTICEMISKRIQLRQMLMFFDQFYFHQPRTRLASTEATTGNIWKDTVLEGEEFEQLFDKCKKAIGMHIPGDTVIHPVRGYIRGMFKNEPKDQIKFHFDVVRL